MVSVVVPNYNHKNFLFKRLDSIFNQSFQDFDVILLDDFSTDGSWKYLKQFESHPKVSHCFRNEVNSRSPFKQWKKGIEHSKADLIWIAESDDWSELTYLEHCVPYFESEEVGMVIAASKYVDGKDQVLGKVPLGCPSGSYDGVHFVKNYMYFNNSVLNASSVVFRKSLISDSILDRIADFRLSGDHLFWADLMGKCKLMVLEDQLNYFRWHEQSVRNQELKNLTGLKEGIKIKLYLEEHFEIDRKDKTKARGEAYLKYFKFLNDNPRAKKVDEFLEISSFFSSMNKLKAWIRFILFS